MICTIGHTRNVAVADRGQRVFDERYTIDALAMAVNRDAQLRAGMREAFDGAAA